MRANLLLKYGGGRGGGGGREAGGFFFFFSFPRAGVGGALSSLGQG